MFFKLTLFSFLNVTNLCWCGGKIILFRKFLFECWLEQACKCAAIWEGFHLKFLCAGKVPIKDRELNVKI